MKQYISNYISKTPCKELNDQLFNIFSCQNTNSLLSSISSDLVPGKKFGHRFGLLNSPFWNESVPRLGTYVPKLNSQGYYSPLNNFTNEMEATPNPQPPSTICVLFDETLFISDLMVGFKLSSLKHIGSTLVNY